MRPESAVVRLVAVRRPIPIVPRRKRPQRRGRRIRMPVPRAAPFVTDRFGRSILFAFLAVSLVLHFTGGALSARYFGALRKHAKPSDTVEVTVVQRPPAPPPPPLPPPKVEEPKPEPKPVPHHVVKLAPPPPDVKPLPPPPTAEPPKPVATTPIVIPGLSLSSTSASGGFAVPVGNTFGAPDKVAVNPADVKPYKAEHYAPAYAVTENPVDLNNLSDEEMRKYYPPEALKEQLEAEVRTKITIDDDGSVVKVVVTQPAGHGFDDAAKKLLMKKRFKPARVNGQVVATEIPFVLHFELPY
jgi:protein TonB